MGRSALSKPATYCWLATSNSLATVILEVYVIVQVKNRGSLSRFGVIVLKLNRIGLKLRANRCLFILYKTLTHHVPQTAHLSIISACNTPPTQAPELSINAKVAIRPRCVAMLRGNSPVSDQLEALPSILKQLKQRLNVLNRAGGTTKN